jgi:RimJ/RimL family protein N-acetyltransferase
VASELVLRSANMSDASVLYSWRNDPETRAASHNTTEVQLNEHIAWVRKSLANPDRKLFIAEMDGKPIGTVRADLDDGIWELSWTVAPSERGQGKGRQLVAALAGSINEPIRAEVKKGNVASMKIAEAAAMTLVREDRGILYFARPARTAD